MVISLGTFRMVDFGDLTWNKEHDLACPNNLVGPIDFYLVSHHGKETSSLPMLVHAMHPRAAVMNNGANKGAELPTFETLKKSPGFEDLWQLHYAVDAREHNSPEKFIANLAVGGTKDSGVPDEGTPNTIKMTAMPDGSFTLTNSRNGYHKEYGPHN
jgi:competence protein ComEC